MLGDTLRQEISDHLCPILSNELGKIIPDFSSKDLILEIPPDQKLGDFAFPTFRLAKALRKNPNEIAKDLCSRLTSTSLSTQVDIVATGSYVNFLVKPELLGSLVLKSLLLSGNNLASRQLSKKETVILEYSSVNVAKPFNIYHLRGTMIGNCLARVYKTRGYHCISINHLGDWGTQFGALTLAFEKWGDQKELDTRGISYLVELYVRIHKDMDQDPRIADEAREYFSRLEKGDQKIYKLWKSFVELSIQEFRKTYQKLNVEFDHYWGESFYLDKIPSVEKQLRVKNLLVKSEGAEVISLETYGMPPCIFRKSDGSTTYATRDIAAAIYRFDQFAFSKMVYVVGAEQKLVFQQLFKVLELMGYDWAKNCQHVDFGLYRFKDVKMSTRKGVFVTMESVLDEAITRVRELMSERQPQLTQTERNTAAEIIGAGAIIFNDLATDRLGDVQFDLERVLDFEGETGPYVQYAHTRCLGILKNAPADLLCGLEVNKLTDLNQNQDALAKLFENHKHLVALEETSLIRLLARLPLVLDQVIEQSRPNHLASFLIDVTKMFNAFYRAHKVLGEDPELSKARLALVLATQRVLLKGLDCLGMRVPDRM